MKRILMAGLAAGAFLATTAFAYDEAVQPAPNQTTVESTGDRATVMTTTTTDQPTNPSLTPQSSVTDRTTVYTAPQPVNLANSPRYTRRDDPDHLRGVTVLVGAGVEGYTGALNSEVAPGPAIGVSAAFKPSKVIGIEVGYSGAANEISGHGDYATAVISRADLVRNSGTALATFGLTASPVQPYLMGGVGIDHYSARSVAQDAGFSSSTGGAIPLGGGIRTHYRGFTADARLGYSILFNDNFANVAPRNIVGLSSMDAGRWTGTLMIGSSF